MSEDDSSFIDTKAVMDEQDRKGREQLADELESIGKLIGQKQQALAAQGIQLNPMTMVQLQLQHLTDHLMPPMVDDHPTRPLPRSWERLQFERSWAKVVLDIVEQAEWESQQAQQGIVIPGNQDVINLNQQKNGMNRAQRRQQGRR